MTIFLPGGRDWPGRRFSNTNQGIATISQAAALQAMKTESPQLFRSTLELLLRPNKIPTPMAMMAISPKPDMYRAMLDNSFRFMLSARSYSSRVMMPAV